MNEKEIQLHKLIDNGNEAEAISLLDSDELINVNFELNERIPIFSAINNHMIDLAEKIITNPLFNTKIEDGFEESLLESLIYLYGSDEETKKYKSYFERLIKTIIKSDTYDFNFKDLNDDTALIISCNYDMPWVTEALVAKKNVDINIINDFDYTALTTAITRKNYEAIKIISQREDLVVRDIDVEEAKKQDINLEKYGINTSHLRTTIVDKVAERNREECFAVASK